MPTQNVLVIDTETADSVTHPLVYDLGYKILNLKSGKILKQCASLFYDIFIEEQERMQSAYYAEKIPSYQEQLNNGERKLIRVATARRIIADDISKYNVKAVYAYNMNFDRRALNNTNAFTTENKYRFFFPYGTEFRCIWHMACQVLLARPSYIKFAEKHNFISDKGNILTNAECCYRYLINDPMFQEEHKGLEDVNIEIEILKACYRQHKKMDTKPYQACWRLVQNKRKAMAEL